jgi:hypothetical protein
MRRCVDEIKEVQGLVEKVAELQDFAIWMTGCGYDFCQHDHFIKMRDKLLLDHVASESEVPDECT